MLIASHDRPQLLRALLQDLQNQTLTPGYFEVIISDDGSTIPAQEIVDSLCNINEISFKINILRNTNQGPAAARNRAIDQINAPLLLLLNDDVRLDTQLLQAHLQLHQAAPQPCAWMGTFEFDRTLRRDPFHRIIEDLGLIGTRCMRAGVKLPPLYFWTGNLSLPTRALRAVSGFDEDFSEPKGKDVDLGYRLRDHVHLPLLLSRRPVAWHQHRFDLRSWTQRSAQVGRAQALLAQKHHDAALWPGGILLQKIEDMRAAQARLQMQEEQVGQVRTLLSAMLHRDFVRQSKKIDIPALGQSFLLPQQARPLLQACVAVTTLFDFQKSFWDMLLELKKLKTGA